MKHTLRFSTNRGQVTEFGRGNNIAPYSVETCNPWEDFVLTRYESGIQNKPCFQMIELMDPLNDLSFTFAFYWNFNTLVSIIVNFRLPCCDLEFAV